MKVKKNKEKKINFIDKERNDFDFYKKGAFLGALLGGLTGLIIGRKIIMGIIIGGIGGGYISYQIYKEDNETISFKKFRNS